MDKDKFKKETDEHLLTSAEAREITRQSKQAFINSINDKRIIPFFDKGEGRSKIRLFLKSDIEDYAKTIEEWQKARKKTTT